MQNSCRLGLKCRLRPNLSHCDTFSIIMTDILAIKNEIKTVLWKKPESWDVIEDKCINHLSNSQICASHQSTLQI